MRVKVYATIRPIVGGRHIDLDIEEGATVRELVARMIERWPDLAAMMLDDDGELSGRVHVFVDGRSSRHLPAGSDTQLFASNEVDVFPAVAGG